MAGEARGAISALSEAASFMKNKLEEACLALVPYTKIDPVLAPKVSLQNMTVAGDINRENLQQFINILVEIGELPSGISVDTLLAPTQ